MMNFYHATNSNRNITSAGFNFSFHHYTTSPSVMGVLATDKPDEIAALDALAENPKSGITVIDEREYRSGIGQKRLASDSYAPTLMANTPTPGVQRRPTNEAVDTSPTAPEPPILPVDSVAEAISIVPVQKKVKTK